MKKRAQGFSLVELMVVVVIVGILAKIAYGSYQSYTITGKRDQAKAVMVQISSMEERYYTNNYWYYPASGVAWTAAPTAEPQGWPNFAGTNITSRTYDISVSSGATTYTITAAPATENNFSDPTCGTLTLNNSGQKGQNGGTNNGASPCW